MALEQILTVEQLAETTGQSEEQLRKDREAAAKVAGDAEDE